MQSTQKQVIEMYQRVQDFLGANPPPESPAYSAQKSTLDQVVARLSTHYQDQSAGQRLSRQETRRQAQLRRALRVEHLSPIAQIARAHRDVPGLAVATRTPPPSLSTLRLIQEAVGIRAAVAAQPDVFVASGLPADFLARLDAAIDALRASTLGKARTTGTHVGAARGLAEEIRVGRKAVDLLDVMVRAAFRSDATLLAKWNLAKRVKLVPGGVAIPVTGVADENLEPEVAA